MRQLLIPLLIAVLATIAALLIAVPPRAHAVYDDAARFFYEDGRAAGTDFDAPRAPRHVPSRR